MTALVNAERAPLHDFDTPMTVYEGCMPIEIMAGRGADTIRYGPLQPGGPAGPPHRPSSLGQRSSCGPRTRDGTLYNLVGFQTNLKFGEQKRVFSMIPGLERAPNSCATASCTATPSWTAPRLLVRRTCA